jgi:hypothetical protein
LTIVTKAIQALALIVVKRKWYVKRPRPFEESAPPDWFSQESDEFQDPSTGSWYQKNPTPFEQEE